ncbi:MAG: hypothetical protein COB98_00260 [Flavobacteriaceae bacterium]|nr:MAG: hypothetical protein COB98_00260 [Flavobacteriaceae bacterium]
MNLISKMSVLLLLTVMLLSCSKDNNEALVEEEIVLLEFNSNFSPANNVELLPFPKLEWSLKNLNISEKRRFEIKFGLSETDMSIIKTDLYVPFFDLENKLNPATTYFWQVSFINRDKSKTVSEIQHFTTLNIEFKDPEITQIIRDILDKPTGVFTKEELSSIINFPNDLTLTDFEALKSYGEIESLSGLEYCTNLERLVLQQNGFMSPLKDLKPIEKLTAIKYLNLSNNKISDLSSLKNLTELAYLHLGWNIGISDISPLANLKKLKTLNLTYTHNLRDVSPFKDLSQLDSLKYNSAEYIEDISPMKYLVNLKLLRFSHGKKVTDFSFLEKLVKIEKLYLRSNIHLKDLSFVSKMPNLKRLSIAYTGITDIAALSDFSAMEYLNLGGLKITDFSVLKSMPNLKELHFNDSEIDASILSTEEIKQLFPSAKIHLNGATPTN